MKGLPLSSSTPFLVAVWNFVQLALESTSYIEIATPRLKVSNTFMVLMDRCGLWSRDSNKQDRSNFLLLRLFDAWTDSEVNSRNQEELRSKN